MSDLSTGAEPGVAPALSRFLAEHRGEILAAWERAVRQHDATARRLKTPVLLDQVPTLLAQLAERTAAPEAGQRPAAEETAESHAVERLVRGFDLGLVAAEFSILRAEVLRLYAQYVGNVVHVDELRRFDLSLDEVFKSSIAEYVRVRELLLLSLDQITAAALGAESTAELLPKLLDTFMQGVEGVDTAAILLLEQDKLRVRATAGRLKRDHGWTVALGEGFAGKVAAMRRPLFLQDTLHDPDVVEQLVRREGIHAMYGVPLFFGDELLGVAQMASLSAEPFTDEDTLLFRAMAARAGAFVGAALSRERELRSKEALRQERDRYEAIVLAQSDLGQGLAITNGSRFDFVNDAFARITGYDTGELLAMQDVRSLILQGASLPPTDLRVDTVPRTVQSRLRKKDGSVAEIELAAKPLEGGRRLLAIHDITERLQDQHALQRDLSFRDRLVSILSHDIRNPLTVIRTATAYLARLDGLAPQTSRFVRQIDRAADRIGQMLSGLLDFTQARFRGQLPLALAPCDLRTVLSEILDETRAANPPAKIIVNLEGDLRGTWDASRLGQLVSNLLTNAIRHGTADQPVDVTARGERDAVELAVHNQGEPIPPEFREVMFEPFSRAQSENRADSPQGFGLGLFIVDQIVRGHGGTIRVVSERDAGTTFTVRLPRVPPAPRGA